MSSRQTQIRQKSNDQPITTAVNAQGDAFPLEKEKREQKKNVHQSANSVTTAEQTATELKNASESGVLKILEDLPKNQKTLPIVGMAVRKNGLALKYAPAFKNKRTIVLAAVKQNGLALQYASKELRNDPGIVDAAVSQNKSAIQFAYNIQDFLRLFVVVKYAVFFYTYGVLDPNIFESNDINEHSLYEEFKELLMKVDKQENDNLESKVIFDMTDGNPLTIVTLSSEMMKFIFEEMSDETVCVFLYEKTRRHIYGDTLSSNFTKKTKFLTDNRKILKKFSNYIDIIYFKKYLPKDVSAFQEKMSQTMHNTTNLQDFGNIIAKYIMDRYVLDPFRSQPKPKSQTGPPTLNVRDDNTKPKLQTGPPTKIDELRRQFHELIEKFMELLHLNKGEKQTKLQ